MSWIVTRQDRIGMAANYHIRFLFAIRFAQVRCVPNLGGFGIHFGVTGVRIGEQSKKDPTKISSAKLLVASS
jgi:hypothetical protein